MDSAASILLQRRAFLAGSAVLPLLPSLARAASSRMPLKALVIGNNAYSGMKPLSRAVADAQGLAKRLTGFGYQVSQGYDLGIGPMIDLIDQFRAGVSPDAFTFIYFAGHGIQASGVNFLLPCDADGEDPEAMLAGSVQLGTMLSDIAAQKPLRSVALIDACRNAAAVKAVPGGAGGFASVRAPAGFYVAYSAGAGEFALDRLEDDDKDPNGLFMRHFLPRLRADMSFDRIVKDTRALVTLSARKVGHVQVPAIYDQCPFEFRLDGGLVAGSTDTGISAGRMHATAVLLVGVQSYGPPADLLTPATDVRKLEGIFRSLGADVHVSIDQSRDEVLTACTALSQSGADRLIVYFAGKGVMIGKEAVFMLSAKDGEADVPFTPGDPAFQLLYLGEALKKLRRPKAKTPPAGARGLALAGSGHGGDPRPIITIADFCLDAVEVEARKSTAPALLATVSEDTQGEVDGTIALLTSGGFFQRVLDATQGESQSPFTIALANALARPGLTLAQFASHVRGEVETLTDSFQTPLLLAPKSMRNMVLVEPVPEA